MEPRVNLGRASRSWPTKKCSTIINLYYSLAVVSNNGNANVPFPAMQHYRRVKVQMTYLMRNRFIVLGHVSFSFPLFRPIVQFVTDKYELALRMNMSFEDFGVFPSM